MGEGGHRVRGTEAREGAAMVWVKQARLSRKGCEPYGEDALKDHRDSLEENDDAEGGWGVIGRFARLVKDNSVCVFETGGVVPNGNQWG